MILATEYTLILFLTDLASAYIFQATIKVYLSAVQNLHVSKHFHYEFSQRLTPQIHLILRSIKRHQASTHPPRIHLPITIQILHGTWRLLTQKSPFHANTILWTASCLELLEFLRVSEFIVTTKASYNSPCHLALQDIVIDNRDYPWLLQTVLKQSKTDPFRKGAKINIGATNRTICPIKAILSYLVIRGSQTGSLL